MKTKYNFIVMAVAILTAAALYASKGAILHNPPVAASVTDSKEHQEYDEASSNTHLLSVAQTRLQKAGQALTDAEFVVKQEEDRGDKVTEELQALKCGADVARTRLARLRPAVESNSGMEIGAVSYNATEVKTEARRLANFIQASVRSADRKNIELKQIQKISAYAQTELEKSRSNFSTAQGQLHDLDAKLKLAEASNEVATATTSAQRSLSAELKGDFSDIVGILERRLLDIQRENANLNPEAPEGEIVWQAEPTTVSDTGELSDFIHHCASR